ncbi:MAG: hypothetical protein WD749_08535 [Phycisphaerales bacterium]
MDLLAQITSSAEQGARIAEQAERDGTRTLVIVGGLILLAVLAWAAWRVRRE